MVFYACQLITRKELAMQINQAKFTAIVETAKAKAANDPKWLRAIERAAAGILSGELIVTTLVGGALVTTPRGTYAANGHCNCEAARLMDRYETEMASAVSAPAPADELETALADYLQSLKDHARLLGLDVPAPEEKETAPAAVSLATDVETSSRANLIAEIENIWPRFAPGLPLYTELLARFGKSDLNMLDDDMLRRVRLAIAL